MRPLTLPAIGLIVLTGCGMGGVAPPPGGNTPADEPQPPGPDCADCDDGIFCNGAETCNNGVCEAGPDPCAQGGVCDEQRDACVACLANHDCGENETCVNNVCLAGCVDDADCDDGDPCTTDLCVLAACQNRAVDCGDQTCNPDDGGCVDCLEDADCVDGDTCDAGVCEGGVECVEDADCAEGEVCNAGVCEAAPTGCVKDADCDDGLFCTGTETCVDAVCVAGVSPCAEGEDCTEETDTCKSIDFGFILTEEVDTFTGTVNDDVFVGSDVTYSAGDDLNGGDGTDRLNLTTTAAETDLVYMRNIEQAYIRNIFDGQAINVSGWEGVTELSYYRGTEDVTLSGVAFLPTIVLIDGAGGTSDFDVEFADSLCNGTDDAISIEMVDAAVGEVTLQGVHNTDGFEWLNINLNGENEATALATADLETVVITGTGSLRVTNALAGAETIDASGLSAPVELSADNVDCNIIGGVGHDALSGGDGRDVIDGGDGNDILTGDTPTIANAVTDELTGGADRDRFVLSSVAASSANADTVTDFTTGANGDRLDLDMSLIETSGATDSDAVVDFVQLQDGSAVVDTDAILIHECTVARGCTPAANANVIVMIHGTFDSTDSLETAMEEGGSTPLTVHADAGNPTSAFPVAYTDGTDAFLAICFANTESTDDIKFEAGDLICVNYARMEGISATPVAVFDATNFDYLP